MTPFAVIVTWSGGPVATSGVSSRGASTTIEVPGAFVAEAPQSEPGWSGRPYLAIDHGAQRVFVGDVRLYDRPAVERQIGGDSAQLTDIGLLARRFQLLGAEAFSDLVGDFAVVIWEWGRGVVHAARDHFGVAPLYYRPVVGGLAFASDLRRLLALGIKDREIDSDAALDYLLSDHAHFGRTLYKGIRSVRPAHMFSAGMGFSSERRYWVPPSEPFAGGHEDAREEWSRVFRLAVRDRLPLSGNTAAYLSGGLDSGAVVGAAFDECQARGADPATLLTLSGRFPGLDCDESPYIEAARTRNSGTLAFEWDGTAVSRGDLDDPSIVRPGLRGGIAWSQGRELAELRRRGIRIALMGTGGDDLGWSHGVFRDLLCRGHIMTLAREMALMGTRQRALRNLIANLRGAGARRGRREAPGWLGPELLKIFPGSRDERDVGGFRFSSRTQQQTWRVVNLPQASWIIDGLAQVAADQGVEIRLPYRDVRLVNLTLSLPWSLRLPHGDMRSLQRGAVAPLLAPTVRERLGRTLFSSALTHQVRSQRDKILALFYDPQWASAALVDQAGARVELATARARDPDCRHARTWLNVWKIAVFEAWHRAVNAYTPHLGDPRWQRLMSPL